MTETQKNPNSHTRSVTSSLSGCVMGGSHSLRCDLFIPPVRLWGKEMGFKVVKDVRKDGLVELS